MGRPRKDTTDLQLLTGGDVAALLGCSRKHAYHLLASGQIPVVRIGKLVRVRRSALAEFIAQSTIPAVQSGQGEQAQW